ncbi:intermembrane transport protein PqiB [Motiliproteus sediminis]|uniref:intermembrane transport protein PqiB n=1 Tax=Motiliproteus sediminis TaxID=1468178 RepID=UPI001AEFB62D|nr:intermembrane transport protein PqiB [Motiliproteus sediminis]
MADDNHLTAQVTERNQLSAVWIIPLLALAMGAWMLYQYINSSGPEVTLKLRSADGIEAGKTPIKALNVKVGVITAVTLSENYDYILATAQMNKDASRMLRKDSLFWTVKPRIGREGVSGLETLLSGAYIQLQPGVSSVAEDSFTVLDLPPVAAPDTKGLRLSLTHREAEKLGVGAPVIYEGFTVGRVEESHYDVNEKQAIYQLFIFAPYDRLVNTGSRFWLSSGVDLRFNAEGFEVKLASLESLLRGGVTFGDMDPTEQGEPITQQLTRFRLYDDLDQVREGLFDHYLEYVMLFDESVRGLQPLAPVEYRGLRIGTVKQLPLRSRMSRDLPDIDTSNGGLDSKKIPVLVSIEVERLYNQSDSDDLTAFEALIDQEFGRGLRGTLKIGNLVTGALFIDTDFHPDEAAHTPQTFAGYPVFPTKQGSFAEVQKQIMDLARKLNSLPLEQTISSLNRTLASSERAVTAAEQLAQEARILLQQQDITALPAELRQSLQQLTTTLSGFDPESASYQQLTDALAEVTALIQQLRPIARQLHEKPNALIFGNSRPDPIPTKGQPQ